MAGKHLWLRRRLRQKDQPVAEETRKDTRGERKDDSPRQYNVNPSGSSQVWQELIIMSS